jgi:hypothetical protein
MDPKKQRKLHRNEKAGGGVKNESYNSEESEADSEVENSYQNDSFVVDDDDESSYSEDSDEERVPKQKPELSKKPKKKKKEYKLDSESEELINDYEQKNKSRLKKLSQKNQKVKRQIDSDDSDVKPEKFEQEEDSSNSFLEKEKSDNQAYVSKNKPTNALLQRLFKEDEIDEEEHKRQVEILAKNVQGLELQEIFEPGDLAQNYETPLDRFIIQSDRPERLQLRIKNLDLPTNEELVEETNWIVEKLVQRNTLSHLEQKTLLPKIMKILEYLRLASCEIMYIWNYKQQEFSTDKKNLDKPQYELKLADLWFVYELHMEWIEVYKKHKTITKLFDVLTQHISISTNLRNAM